MRRAFVRRLRHWVANRGWGGLFAEVWRQGKLRLKARRSGGGAAAPAEGAPAEPVGAGPKVHPPKVHPFDERYGVETGGLIWSESLDAVGGRGKGSEYWATGYYGIAPSVLWQALDRLALEWERFTFVDVGSGKGRALMLALRYPFRAALGVELSADLTRVAEGNLERFRADWRLPVPVEVKAGDATQMELPGGPLLLYLYHPFAAPVMDVLLERVRASLGSEPREVYLLYMNPELDARMSGMPFLERVWRESFRLSEEDTRADQFGSNQEVVSAYRFVGGLRA